MPRRSSDRFAVQKPSALKATWLANGRAVNGMGTLLDISAGGFSARMASVPPQGRILHARFVLETAPGAPLKLIEAGARVCGLARSEDERNLTPAWIVNFAIEAIHPTDKKLMARAINFLKAAQ